MCACFVCVCVRITVIPGCQALCVLDAAADTDHQEESHLQVQVVQVLLQLKVGVVGLSGDTVEVT